MLLLPNKSELRSPVAPSLSLTLYGFMCHTSRSAKSKSCLSGATQNNKLRVKKTSLAHMYSLCGHSNFSEFNFSYAHKISYNFVFQLRMRIST